MNTYSPLLENVLEWALEGALALALAEPPLVLPSSMQAKKIKLPLLRKRGQRSSTAVEMLWPQHDLACAPYPYIGCVLEGAADIRIGCTPAMAAATGEKGGGGYCLRFPQRSVFLFPPGLPHSAGMRPHWEGSSAGRSLILWILVTPEGAMLHTCRTDADEHTHQPGYFFLDSHLTLIVNAMLEELRERLPVTQEIARTLLRALLQRLSHAVATQPSQSGVSGFRRADDVVSAHDEIVQRACRYIGANLPQPLSVAEIAANAYVSEAQLNRLFQRHLQTSVMEYVIEQRIATIQSLLANTQMSIRHISDHLGYNSAYLSQLFKTRTGVSPANYRRLQQNGKK